MFLTVWCGREWRDKCGLHSADRLSFSVESCVFEGKLRYEIPGKCGNFVSHQVISYLLNQVIFAAFETAIRAQDNILQTPHLRDEDKPSIGLRMSMSYLHC